MTPRVRRLVRQAKRRAKRGTLRQRRAADSIRRLAPPSPAVLVYDFPGMAPDKLARLQEYMKTQYRPILERSLEFVVVELVAEMEAFPGA